MANITIETFSYPRPAQRYRNTDRAGTGEQSWMFPWPLKCRSHRERIWKKRLIKAIRNTPDGWYSMELRES